MINGDKKRGNSSQPRREKKIDYQISEKERGKARNRSASAKWAGNRGESSAHLRVKWTVDNINRAAAPPPPERNARRKISNDTFCPRVSPATPITVFLPVSFSLSLIFSSLSHDSASRENTSREIFRDAVSLVPRRKSLNAIKVFLEKILREVSSRVQR